MLLPIPTMLTAKTIALLINRSIRAYAPYDTEDKADDTEPCGKDNRADPLTERHGGIVHGLNIIVELLSVRTAVIIDLRWLRCGIAVLLAIAGNAVC